MYRLCIGVRVGVSGCKKQMRRSLRGLGSIQVINLESCAVSEACGGMLVSRPGIQPRLLALRIPRDQLFSAHLQPRCVSVSAITDAISSSSQLHNLPVPAFAVVEDCGSLVGAAQLDGGESNLFPSASFAGLLR